MVWLSTPVTVGTPDLHWVVLWHAPPTASLVSKKNVVDSRFVLKPVPVTATGVPGIPEVGVIPVMVGKTW
jgi:hypothetical protein